MRPPSLKTLILGHPLSVLMSFGLTAYLCWLGYLHAINSLVFIAVSGLWLIRQSLSAFDYRRRYRIWRRDCMTIAGVTAKPVIPLWLRRIAGVCFFAGAYSWLITNSDESYQVLALGFALVALILLLSLALPLFKRLLRFPRRKRSVYEGPVAVVVRAPIQPVPSLKDAYRALPDYCDQVLKVGC